MVDQEHNDNPDDTPFYHIFDLQFIRPNDQPDCNKHYPKNLLVGLDKQGQQIEEIDKNGSVNVRPLVLR